MTTIEPQLNSGEECGYPIHAGVSYCAEPRPCWLHDGKSYGEGWHDDKPARKNACPCACHENKLKKPYLHDTKCCAEMNGTLHKPSKPETCSVSGRVLKTTASPQNNASEYAGVDTKSNPSQHKTSSDAPKGEPIVSDWEKEWNESLNLGKAFEEFENMWHEISAENRELPEEWESHIIAFIKDIERKAEERGFNKCLSIRGIELNLKAIEAKAREEERKRIIDIVKAHGKQNTYDAEERLVYDTTIQELIDRLTHEP
jgi:hypothetical protein